MAGDLLLEVEQLMSDEVGDSISMPAMQSVLSEAERSVQDGKPGNWTAPRAPSMLHPSHSLQLPVTSPDPKSAARLRFSRLSCSSSHSDVDGEEAWTDTSGQLSMSELSNELSKKQESTGREIAVMLLHALSKQQVEHEKRVEQLMRGQKWPSEGGCPASPEPSIDGLYDGASLPPGMPTRMPLVNELEVAAEVNSPSAIGKPEKSVFFASEGKTEFFSEGRPSTLGIESCDVRLMHDVSNKRLSVNEQAPAKSYADQMKDMQTLHKEANGHRKTLLKHLEADGRHGYIYYMSVSIVADRKFELAICILIFMNSLAIGMEANQGMTKPFDETNKTTFRVANGIFTFIFLIELILRLTAEGMRFFNHLNSKFRWNVFDVSVVLITIVEEILQVLLSDFADVGVVRILRTMRIVRGFRIVRVFAFFRDLRIMVAGIMHSLQPLIWAVSLLISIMYLVSVCLLQFAANEHVAQLSNDTVGIALSEKDYAELLKYYGDLPRTLYTLYCSIVGGIDWADAAEPLMKMSTGLGLLFCCYVAFAVLCVLNIITGVFVENANRTTAQDEEMVMMEQMEVRRQWFEEVKDLFEQADTDGSGQLDAEEFGKQMEDLRMQAWLRKIGVHVESYSANGLFKLLDFDGDGKLDLDEFAMALQQVHGNARSIDVAKINRQATQLRKEVKDLSTLCTRAFQVLARSNGVALPLNEPRSSTDSRMQTVISAPGLGDVNGLRRTGSNRSASQPLSATNSRDSMESRPSPVYVSRCDSTSFASEVGG